MSDLIKGPYELSIWETTFEENHIVNLIPPLSTVYSDEWTVFNKKISLNTGKTGFWDWISDDVDVSQYDKEWVHFSFLNAKHEADDEYTYEINLDLGESQKKSTFLIQFRNLVEKKVWQDSTFKINDGDSFNFKDYINDPYVLNLTADTKGKIKIKINFTIPWSGQPATLLRGSINSKLSFDTKIGLFEGSLQAFPDPFPLYNEAQGNWIRKERKIYTIGSDTMTAQTKAINPIVKTKINGEKILTFSLYSRFFDEEIGEFRDNPFIKFLSNEVYLKLYRKNETPEWEEYIIKDVSENSENKTFTYTAKRASIIELSKSGYSLEFKAELMNNQGTAIELAKQVFAGTDWEVDEAHSDKFWGNSVEPVYEATINKVGNFKCIRQANIGSPQLYYNSIQSSPAPKKPSQNQKIYIPYSSYQTRGENGFIQFLWAETNDIEVDEKGIIYNANSYIWPEFSDSNIKDVAITGQIKGDNLQKRKKTKYIKGIERIVEEGIMTYNGTEETCYKIIEVDYQTSNSVSELMVNGRDFESTAGWRPVSNSVHINLNTDKDTLSNILDQAGYLVKLQLLNTSETKPGVLYNAAIRSNLTVIDNMVQGEEFCLEIGENSSGIDKIKEIIVGYQKEDEVFEKILSFTPQIGTITASCSQSVSNKELASGDIKLYFILKSNANVLLDKISLFKKIMKNETEFYRPGDNIEAKAITKEIYYNPYYSDNINATSIDEIVPAKNGTFIPNEYKDYVKISSIETSKSNRFNILQEICEAFECWADLQIEHDEKGKITNKKIVLKNFIGDNKNVGFSYGVNLKGVTRNLVSDQIVTKMIVEPNNNENGLNGFSTIARAKNNKSKDNTLYNFDYYINQGSLKAEEVSEDLYAEKGLLYRLGKINNKIMSINEKLIAQQMELNYAKSNYTTSKELVEKTQEELIQLNEDFYDRKQIEIEDALEEDDLEKYEGDSNLRNILINYKIFKNKLEQYEADLTNYSELIDEIEQEIESLQKEIEVRTRDQKNYLNIFTEKYANYIQEGTWTDESYYDDDLYYLDAQNVLYTSAFPKVSYTIDVIDVSPLGEEYSPFKFKVGDKTYIEDVEFFGWNATKTSPYKEEVVISEIEEYLDSPEQNKITVQNYKTQFEDLFQRIAATTQSLQSAAGAYQRAANKVTSTNSIDPETLQNSFVQGIIDLQNMGNMSIKWTSEGLVISNQKDTNNKLRLSNIGIAQSEDGGEVWKTVLLAGRGITANSIVTGTLDANKISIKSGDAATFIWDAKGLRAYETIWGENGEVSNVNFNNYIEFNDRGLVSYRNNGTKTFELTAEGNLTLSGSLKVAVLEYGKVQAVGGILLIRPSSLIKKAEYDEANNLTKIWVETPSQFSDGDWCVIGSNLEDIGKGNNATPYEILSINENDKYLTFRGNLIETFGDLANLALTSIVDSNNNIGIAINSSTNEAFSNARSFSIFESSVDNNTWVRDTRLILGEIPWSIIENHPLIKNYLTEGSTTYGLYAENAIIKGTIDAESGKIGGWEITNTYLRSYRHPNEQGKGQKGRIYLSTGDYESDYEDPSTDKRYTDWIYCYNEENKVTFRLTKDGVIIAKGADIEGTITASTGYIGGTSGWTIKAGAIYSGTTSMTSTAVGTYIGTDGIRNYSSNNAYVNIQNGILTAKSVDLSGLIKTSVVVDLNNTEFLQYSDVADWWNATKSSDQKKYEDLGWFTSPPKWRVDNQYRNGYEEEMETLFSQTKIGLFQKIQIKDTTEFQEANLTPNQGLYLSNKEYYLNLNTSVFSIKSSKDGEESNTEDTLERFKISFPISRLNATLLETNGLILGTEALLGSIKTAFISTKALEFQIMGENVEGVFALYYNTDNKTEMSVTVNKTTGVLYGLHELEQIGEGADINDYVTPGVYGVSSNIKAQSIKNLPIQKAGKLITYSPNGSPVKNSPYHYLTQEYTPLDEGYPTYRRALRTDSGKTWNAGEWYRQSGAVNLWKGLDKMDGSKPIPLSETVSRQPHGIVLRFVAIDPVTEESYDYHYQEFFVAKDFVETHKGKGHTFAIWGNYFNAAATKYLYIYDGEIKGNEANVTSGSASGINYNNSKYALCEVIGV